MKINRNLVANALMITFLTGGAAATTTAKTPNAVTLNNSTGIHRSHTTNDTGNATRGNVQTYTVVTGTDNETQ